MYKNFDKLKHKKVSRRSVRSVKVPDIQTKTQLEHEKKVNHELISEIDELKQQLALTLDKVETVKSELDSTRQDYDYNQILLDRYTDISREQEAKIEELREKLIKFQSNQRKNILTIQDARNEKEKEVDKLRHEIEDLKRQKPVVENTTNSRQSPLLRRNSQIRYKKPEVPRLADRKVQIRETPLQRRMRLRTEQKQKQISKV